MPHLKQRYATQPVLKAAKLWPVIGILGPRQSGKSTLVRELLGISDIPISFDDLELRDEASKSPKAFLARIRPPIVLDEVQKAPEIFDAIKLRVDQKRIPGSFYLTGSSSFSAKIGIRESLTGRIGLTELYPMSLGELHQKPFRATAMPSSAKLTESRFKIEDFAQGMLTGGMPIPAFLREAEQRDAYWRSWLDTTILRDLARYFKRGYNFDLAFSLLDRMGALFREGELPTLKHFKQPARTVRTYFEAMREIFLLRKIECHPEGIGKEVWLTMDSGLAAFLMGKSAGEGASLTLARHFLWNEWGCQKEYQGQRITRVYYKSAQGSPVDAVFDDVPIRIVGTAAAVTRQLKWEERPLLGAMKRLNSRFGFLIAPVDSIVPPPTRGGIGILPWSYWS